jgi:hypothetical protein
VLIRRDQTISGLPAVELRELMRLLREVAHSTSALSDRLPRDDEHRRNAVERLATDGLIEPTEDWNSFMELADDESPSDPSVVLWTTTISGNAIAKARIGSPISRVKAQQLLDGVLQRAEEVNRSTDWLHWVEAIVLYGSFATVGDGPVGDVDVGVDLGLRLPPEEYLERQRKMIQRDSARCRDIVEAMGYAETKLLRHLRGRSSRVDLVMHNVQHPLPPGAIHRVVFERAASRDGPTIA